MTTQAPDHYQRVPVWVNREINGVLYSFTLPGYRDPLTGQEFITRDVSVQARDVLAQWAMHTAGGWWAGFSTPSVLFRTANIRSDTQMRRCSVGSATDSQSRDLITLDV